MPRYMSIGQGLRSAGNSLARGMMRRNRRKRLAETGEQMFPDVEVPAAYQENPQAAQGLAAAMSGIPGIGQLAGPMQTMQQKVIARESQKANKQAGTQNQMSEEMRRLMSSGDPRLEGIAMQMYSKKFQEPDIPSGANRYMNLGQGLVFDTVKEEAFDYSGEKPEKLTILKPGDGVFKGGKLVFQLPKDEKRKPWLKDLPAGEAEDGTPLTQTTIIFEDGERIPVGEPGIAPGSRQTTGKIGESIVAGDKTYARQQKLDLNRLDRYGKRLTDIADSYEPFYLTYWGRGARTGAEFADKLGVLPDKQKEWLGKISKFEQNVNANINLYIKEITGAQMSEAEASRLMKAMSNLRDSPEEFKSKLDNAIAQLQETKQAKQSLINELMTEDNLSYTEAKEIANEEFADATELLISGFEGGGPDMTGTEGIFEAR